MLKSIGEIQRYCEQEIQIYLSVCVHDGSVRILLVLVTEYQTKVSLNNESHPSFCESFMWYIACPGLVILVARWLQRPAQIL